MTRVNRAGEEEEGKSGLTNPQGRRTASFPLDSVHSVSIIYTQDGLQKLFRILVIKIVCFMF